MYQEPYLTSLKIAIALRQTAKTRGRLTSKDFGVLAKNQDFTPGYFMRVKEVAEELGIGIHALPKGGYLVVDIWMTSTGSFLGIDGFQPSEEGVTIYGLERRLRALADAPKSNTTQVNTKKQGVNNNLIEQLWFELITHAEQRTIVTYNALSQNLGLGHHKKLEKPLRIVQDICQQHAYPSLSSLVVKGVTQLPTGLNASNHDEWQQTLEKAYEFDWSQSLDAVDFEKHHGIEHHKDPK